MAHRQENMSKREVSEKDTKPRKKSIPVKYRVEDGDIYIMSGPYVGSSVKKLWVMSSVERDYIVKNIWFSGDADVAAIIRGLSCQ